jgi:hypothetical protein
MCHEIYIPKTQLLTPNSSSLAFVIGQFIAQGCAAGLETRLDEWAYKAPFAIQWVWPVVLLAGLLFAPESPYWLIRMGRKEGAKKSLEKLTSAKHRPDLDALLVRTIGQRLLSIV